MIFPKRTLAAWCAFAVCMLANAQTVQLHIPAGDLKAALDQYAAQTGAQLMYSVADVRDRQTRGADGQLDAERALSALLAGTGLEVRKDGSNAVLIFRPKASSAAAPDLDDTQLMTVVVTAQKRSQAAQAVPIAVTALSAKTLDVQRVQNLQDVARLTPGLLVSAFSQSNPTIAIRGISNTFSQVGVNKPVGIFVDDVFISRNSAASFDLFDLDSIAVLKGPQGTLFGRNVTGGAIVINTRQPDPGQVEAQGELVAGNYGDKEVRGMFNQPLAGGAAVKVSTSLRRRDGTGTDRLTGREQDDIDSRNFRMQALFRPASNLGVTLSADYSEDKNGGRTLSSNTLGDDGNVRTSELGVPQRFARNIGGASVRIVWTLPAGEVTSISAYRKSKSAEDYSGVGASYALLASGSQSLTSDAEQVHTFSQEFRYASPKWARGDVVAGVYYSDEDGTRQLATRGLAARTGVLASSTRADQAVASRSEAVFADGVLHLPASFDLTLGARYTRDRKSASLLRSDLVRTTNTIRVTDLDHNWNETTPRAVLAWNARPGLMAYLSATRGFTSGGYNADAATAAIFRTPFDPETVNNFEFGIKSQWLDNRLRLNGSVFKMKYRDKQELVNNTLTGVLTIVNAARATVDGGELEVAYKAARWLDLSASYSRLNGHYDRFVAGTIDYSGNPLSNAPRNQYGAAANFSVPVTFGYLVGAASYAWKDTYNTGAANDPNLQIPGYGLTNLSAGIESTDRSWRMLVWVKNASDTSYILTRSTQVVRATYAGEPRTFGLSLSVRY